VRELESSPPVAGVFPRPALRCLFFLSNGHVLEILAFLSVWFCASVLRVSSPGRCPTPGHDPPIPCFHPDLALPLSFGPSTPGLSRSSKPPFPLQSLVPDAPHGRLDFVVMGPMYGNSTLRHVVCTRPPRPLPRSGFTRRTQAI